MNKRNTDSPFGNQKGFRLFGLGKQEFVKYFFGGNAVLSIIALVLISLLLLQESIKFFPDSKQNLDIYRKSGKEFADIASEQLEYQDEIVSLTTKIKSYEIIERAGIENLALPVFTGYQNAIQKKLRDELDDLKVAKSVLKEFEGTWEIWGELDPEKKAIAEARSKKAKAHLESAQTTLTNKVTEFIEENDISILNSQLNLQAKAIQDTDPKIIEKIEESIILYYSGYAKSTKLPAYIEEMEKIKNEKKAEVAQEPFFAPLTEMQTTFSTSRTEYNSYINKMRAQTLAVSNRAYEFLTSAERKKAIEAGITEASPEIRKKLEVDLQRLVTEDQDYDQLAEKVYETLPQQKSIIEAMTSASMAEFSKLPAKSEFTNRDSRKFHKELSKAFKEYEDFMETRNEKMQNWRHDKKIGLGGTIGGFLMGKKWIANSSWQNFFGIRPLFGGSLMITLIAISLATPFAIGAAIYVNRLSTPLEQTIIKPVLEFIQAIPSVVLAFLGIVIVGRTILKISYIEWLDWLPGFPASGEQMVLTAGVLLGFMAIPTMFTLAEDAINNVPKSYSEASLALGASKLQTVFQVIIPSSLSGIVAAVILGFGRIIGETMVVLLVAGGTIKWPETWTSPAHTMTGIIAQSTGEASEGSIQYRALFLVGFVLFLISLVLNSLAQNFIARYGKKD